MLEMPYVASLLSTDAKEPNSTSLVASSHTQFSQKHHTCKVWWIMHKFYIPQKQHILWMSGTVGHKQQIFFTLHRNWGIRHP